MKALITLAVTAALLLVAWQAFRPAADTSPVQAAPVPPAQQSGAGQPEQSETRPAAAEPAQPKAPKRVEVRIELRGGRLASGPEVVRLMQGQTVALTVLSDRDDELHLHGYDIELQLLADQPATLVVDATRSGRFEYEIHSVHATVGALEVYPAGN